MLVRFFTLKVQTRTYLGAAICASREAETTSTLVSRACLTNWGSLEEMVVECNSGEHEERMRLWLTAETAAHTVTSVPLSADTSIPTCLAPVVATICSVFAQL